MAKKYIYVLFIIASAFFIKGGGISFAQTTTPQYRIHVPKVSVPSDDEDETRRITSQFEYWTLICDESLVKKTIICNVRQLVYDQNNNEIFNWSLAASDGKKPYFLMRLPIDIDKKIPISIKFDDLTQPFNINYTACENNYCVAQTMLGPLLLQEVTNGTIAHISYVTAKGNKITFDAPLQGLKRAVESIQK